ncbi:MAG TPA: hypothetical protein VJJ52_03295 [Candidatus Nanoarchaeia archaeon]|nr:hypothetical protein [Candidatus Nanoarchaeia archaeon]
MANQVQTERIDLLVHPFYTISKVYSRMMIDEQSDRNILSLKSLWLDSISDVARNERRCLVLVNGTNVLEQLFPNPEDINPYRSLYREIISRARQLLGQRLFYFYPRLYSNSFSTEILDDGVILAKGAGNDLFYDPAYVGVTAYGEHVDEQTKAGCVDSSIRDLTNLLKIPLENVRINPDKSLPLQPLIRTEFGFDVPTTLYLTIKMIKKLSD